MFQNSICFIYHIAFHLGQRAVAFSGLSGTLNELDLRTLEHFVTSILGLVKNRSIKYSIAIVHSLTSKAILGGKMP